MRPGSPAQSPQLVWGGGSQQACRFQNSWGWGLLQTPGLPPTASEVGGARTSVPIAPCAAGPGRQAWWLLRAVQLNLAEQDLNPQALPRACDTTSV